MNRSAGVAGAPRSCDASSARDPAGSIAREGVEIGRGEKAVIYGLPGGKVAKVFHDEERAVVLEQEFRAASAARSRGVPTWTVERISVAGPERFIVGSFEAGERLSVTLRDRPHAARGLMRRLASVHAEIHRIPPTSHRRWRVPLGGDPTATLRPFLPAATVDRLADVVAGSEIGFGHGDLAPVNILRRGRDLVVLDWGQSGRGPMTADVGQTCMMVMSAPFGRMTPVWLHRRYRRALVDAYVSAYTAETGRSAVEIRIWAAIALLRKASRLPPGRRRSAVEREAARWVRGLAA